MCVHPTQLKRYVQQVCVYVVHIVLALYYATNSTVSLIMLDLHKIPIFRIQLQEKDGSLHPPIRSALHTSGARPTKWAKAENSYFPGSSIHVEITFINHNQQIRFALGRKKTWFTAQ